MERLRCDIILSDAFLAYLEQEQSVHTRAGEVADVATIHYVRCSEGPHQGEAWWNLTWDKRKGMDVANLFRAGNLVLNINQQARRGLRWTYLDYQNGEVVVGGEQAERCSEKTGSAKVAEEQPNLF